MSRTIHIAPAAAAIVSSVAFAGAALARDQIRIGGSSLRRNLKSEKLRDAVPQGIGSGAMAGLPISRLLAMLLISTFTTIFWTALLHLGSKLAGVPSSPTLLVTAATGIFLFVSVVVGCVLVSAGSEYLAQGFASLEDHVRPGRAVLQKTKVRVL